MKIKITLERPTGPIDLVVTADADAAVGEVAEALAEMDPDASQLQHDVRRKTLCLLGTQHQALDPSIHLAESGIRSGAQLTVVPAGEQYAHRAAIPAATIRIIDGPGTGNTFAIAAGNTVVGRAADCDIQLSDKMTSRRHLRVVMSEGIAEVVDLGSANGITLNGQEISRAVWRPGDRLLLGDTTLSIEFVAGQVTRSVAGSHEFNRSPLPDQRYQGPTLKCPTVPDIRRRQRIPMVPAMATPLLMGVIMFIASKTSNSQGLSIASFAFIGMSPVMMLTSAMDTRWSATRGWKGAKSKFHTDLAELIRSAEMAATHERAGRNTEHPTTADCIEAAIELSPLVWSRRPSESRFLQVRLGTATLPSRTVFEPGASLNPDPEALAELSAATDRFATLPGLPADVSLAGAAPLGLAGTDERLAPLARALAVQIATLHSPSEVVIAALLDPTHIAEWDWIKWLPHVSSPHSPLATPHLVSGTEGLGLLTEIDTLIRSRAEGTASATVRLVVFVDDGCVYDRARLVSIAESGRSCGVHIVWLAPNVTSLPAACRTFLDLRVEHSSLTYSDSHAGSTSLESVEGVDVQDADRLARRLSPIVDAGALLDDETDLPRATSWLDLYGTALADSPDAVVERWQESRSVLTGPKAAPPLKRRPGTLRAVIGQAAGEPHALDLRAHGPHVLLGGTTGSGKSELLQSWILGLAASHSPQRVAFLLVDYKGGSAFSDCVNLPHTVGLVTDLNQHLVRRALTSLAAELTFRERLLARKRMKDLLTLEATGDPETPPSLVIVVDEFAALVAEVPDFVNGVVNVAQRGRSLGLHLILATQRPAGVIRDNLRANTNLRVALRMADESDSTDVLGTSLAANFDPTIPGRAISKTGPGRLIPFQAAYAGGHAGMEKSGQDLTVEELVIGATREWMRLDLSDVDTKSDDPGPRDITRVVDTIRRANVVSELPPLRRPWLPELSTLYDLAKLPTRRRDDELVIGVADFPEAQTQNAIAFHPDRDGNLAIYGTSGSGKSTLLRTLAVTAGLTVRGGPCRVYGLDFGARGLRMLDDLPHVGAIVSGDDRDLLTRLLRNLHAELQDRAQRFSVAKAETITDYRRLAGRPDEPRIVLLIDGFSAFRQQYENADSGRWMETLTTLMSDGRPLGIHVVLSLDRASSLPGRLGASVQRKVVMRLADDNEYTTLGARGILDSDSPPGRAVIDGHEVQIAVFGGKSEVFEQSRALEKLVLAMRQVGTAEAPAVAILDKFILLSTLPASIAGSPVIGVCDDDLAPIGIPTSGVFAVAGPSGSGRTTTCAAIYSAMQRVYPDLVSFRYGRYGTDLGTLSWTREATSLDGAKAMSEELNQALSDTSVSHVPFVVLVEHLADFAGSAAEPAMVQVLREALKSRRVLVISEGSVPEYTRTLSQLIPLLRGEHSGILLQPEQSDGYSMFKVNLPRCSRDQFPPGRGFLVSGSSARLVQVAVPSS